MTMTVPFIDLSRRRPELAREIEAATKRVQRSGRYLFGAELEAFESEIAMWFGVPFAVGVGTGTAAIEVALRACGLSGKTVSIPTMTCPPTINAVEAAGATPTLVDMNAKTRNAETAALKTEAALTPDGVLAVHLYGRAFDATGVDVEDCAHVFGAKVNGKLAGTMGRCGALSFFPTKVLGADGDGGMVITSDKDIAERARKIRHYGYEADHDISLRGLNSRLSEYQAAVLRAKLPHVKNWITVRRLLAARYISELKGKVTLPEDPPGSEQSWTYFVIQHPERDRIQAELEARGIATMRHYDRALHQYTRWSGLGIKGQFPNAEKLAAECLSLPLFPFMKQREQQAVIEALREVT